MLYSKLLRVFTSELVWRKNSPLILLMSENLTWEVALPLRKVKIVGESCQLFSRIISLRIISLVIPIHLVWESAELIATNDAISQLSPIWIFESFYDLQLLIDRLRKNIDYFVWILLHQQLIKVRQDSYGWLKRRCRCEHIINRFKVLYVGIRR